LLRQTESFRCVTVGFEHSREVGSQLF
jgi:hypothetical protein